MKFNYSTVLSTFKNAVSTVYEILFSISKCCFSMFCGITFPSVSDFSIDFFWKQNQKPQSMCNYNAYNNFMYDSVNK